jgi:hypothetical protein
MRVCRERASTDLRRLKQTIERTNRERMDRFMELARTHVTGTEIEKQMKERQKRATDITLELAGDLDEHGEAELRSAVHSLDAKRIQTRRQVLDTFSNEAYLRGVITKLREVTVRCVAPGCCHLSAQQVIPNLYEHCAHTGSVWGLGHGEPDLVDVTQIYVACCRI